VRAVYWAGILIIAALVSLFAASNREIVSLGLWPLPFIAQAPLYLAVLVALFFGFAIGALAAWIKGRRRRRQLRDCRRQNEALARELAATQSRLADSAPTTRAALTQPR
jgi:lipopolysaccharide assembly protein A